MVVQSGGTRSRVKSASKGELAEAVRATGAGRAVFTPGLAGLVLGEYRRIARRRLVMPSLSHRTVENHVQATFRKLQVANRVELARYAIEHGPDGQY
jgi:DNA-binding NarL/FixJ family response regulator